MPRVGRRLGPATGWVALAASLTFAGLLGWVLARSLPEAKGANAVNT
jgi:hypothetical protein